jgi:flagellar FliJ protein
MFKFDLEPVLNHRRYQEEILQKKLAESRIRLTAEQKKLRRLKEKKHEYARTFRSLQEQAGMVSDLILYIRYLDRLSKEIGHQKQKVIVAEKEFNQKRNDLIEVLKKRKMLEKLKEKAWKTHQQRLLKNERKFMDEVAVKQFSSKS